MEVRPGYKQTEVGVIPAEWHVRPCREITRAITVGIVVKPTQYYRKSGVPVLRSANVREGGISLSDLVYMSERANALLAKSQLRNGDVVTVRTGYPGTSAVVPRELAGANCVDILISRPGEGLDPAFLAAWINSPWGKDQVLRSQSGLAQQHFNVGELRGLLVATPSLPEQEAIAQTLGNVDALLDGLDRLVAKKRDLKQAAMQQLLTGRTRLPGFHGDWEAAEFGDISSIRNAKIVPSSTPAGTQCVELESSTRAPDGCSSRSRRQGCRRSTASEEGRTVRTSAGLPPQVLARHVRWSLLNGNLAANRPR